MYVFVVAGKLRRMRSVTLASVPKHWLQERYRHAANTLLDQLTSLDLQKMLQHAGRYRALTGRLKDADVVLLLGATGSGKTAIFDLMTGRVPAEEYVPTLFAVARSVRYGGRSYMVCDTPGITNCSAMESSIVNSRLLAEALKESSSVKIIVTISGDTLNLETEGKNSAALVCLLFFQTACRSVHLSCQI